MPHHAPGGHTADHRERVAGHAGEGDIHFDPAAWIEDLGLSGDAGGRIHPSGGHLVQVTKRAGCAKLRFRNWVEVKQGGAGFKDCGLAYGDRVPALDPGAIEKLALGWDLRESETPLPPGSEAKVGALRRPAVMQGAAVQIARGHWLFKGPVSREEVSHGPGHARLHVPGSGSGSGGGSGRVGAGHVDLREVWVRAAIGKPVSQGLTDPGGGHDADRVQAGGDEQTIDLRGFNDKGRVSAVKLSGPFMKCRIPVSLRAAVKARAAFIMGAN